MALTLGGRLGVYEVTAQIGEGGMGEVYRARDTKLNRDVALKILPDAFAGDPDRLARFIREAQTLASLNHPNIAIIHDGTGTAERLTKPEQGTSHVPESWSPDGKRFLFAATKGPVSPCGHLCSRTEGNAIRRRAIKEPD